MPEPKDQDAVTTLAPLRGGQMTLIGGFLVLTGIAVPIGFFLLGAAGEESC